MQKTVIHNAFKVIYLCATEKIIRLTGIEYVLIYKIHGVLDLLIVHIVTSIDSSNFLVTALFVND